RNVTGVQTCALPIYLADDAPEHISTVLLDGEALAASAAPLADAEIVAVDSDVPESFQDDDITQQVVEIRYKDADDQSRATSVVEIGRASCRERGERL